MVVPEWAIALQIGASTPVKVQDPLSLISLLTQPLVSVFQTYLAQTDESHDFLRRASEHLKLVSPSVLPLPRLLFRVVLASIRNRTWCDVFAAWYRVKYSSDNSLKVLPLTIFLGHLRCLFASCPLSALTFTLSLPVCFLCTACLSLV